MKEPDVDLGTLRFTTREWLRGSTMDTCYRWANARRMMKPENARGRITPYSDDGYTWTRDVQNSTAPFNYIMKGAQLGLTECGINRALYEVDAARRDVLYVLPTKEAAGPFSKARFKVAIDCSPYLTERFDYTVDVMMNGVNALYCRGAKNDINLKSTPVSVMILDEVDELEDRQIWLANERLSGHADKAFWAFSTPTIPNFGIHRLYINSNQRHYFFKCPMCSRRTELIYPDSFVVCGESVDDPDIVKSHLICKECKGVLRHELKHEWLSRDNCSWEFVDTAAKNPDHIGWYIPQFYSSTVAPHETAVSYIRGQSNEEAEIEFHNSKVAIPYVKEGSRVTDKDIDACIQKYTTADSTPKGGRGTRQLITMGKDQGKFNHWVAVLWTITRGDMGDVCDRARGRVIGYGRYLTGNDWSEGFPLMRMYQVRACVCDARPEIIQARRFARGFPGYVWLCDYVEGKVSREMTVMEDEFGASIAKVDRTSWTAAALGRLLNGRIELPLDTSLELRRQLKGMVRTYKKGPDGSMVATYQKVDDDHFAHALIYAEIALKLLDPSLTEGDGFIRGGG